MSDEYTPVAGRQSGKRVKLSRNMRKKTEMGDLLGDPAKRGYKTMALPGCGEMEQGCIEHLTH